VTRTDNTGGVSILRQTSWTIEKRDLDKTIHNAARRGTVESIMEDRLQIGENKWRKGLFEERSENTDGDHQMQDQNWRSDAPVKWDMIVTGKWMQKETWNRWVTTLEWDQPHKTPITTTWTTDFLTREGNIQMGFVNYVNGVERWSSNY
jgi:hypothetical protein